MLFPFALPTTSHLTFHLHFISPTHPSLPVAVTHARNAVRSALKAHRRLAPAQRVADLPKLLNVLNEYLPYLFTLDAGLSGKPVAGESVDINLLQEIEVEWRSPLLSTPHPVPGRNAARIKGRGLDYEVFNVLQSLAVVHHLLSRASLLQLQTTSSSELSGFGGGVDPPSSRTSLIQTATKHLQVAHSLHMQLLHLTHHETDGSTATFPEQAVDVRLSTQSCLAELSLAQGTLLFVLKDDPYPALVQQSRDKNDREWMVKAPEVPQVRAHLFARLCFSAAEHASRALAAIAGETGPRRLIKELVAHCEDVRKTARARGCRFLGLDAGSGGKTGEAIAWLRGGMVELGLEMPRDGRGERTISLGRLKSSWTERREDEKKKKTTTTTTGVGEKWGSDAGKVEESRIIDWLDKKWTKENDLVNVQPVPDHLALLATRVPSGREAFGNQPVRFVPELLDEDVLARMRAPLEVEGDMDDDDDDADDGQSSISSGDEVREGNHGRGRGYDVKATGNGRRNTPGAFPAGYHDGDGDGDVEYY